MRQLRYAIVIIYALLLVPTSLAAQDWAKERVDNSPRRKETAMVQAGDRTVHSFVVYPLVEEKVTAVIVIHENQGLTDWVRSAADQVAEAGYVAIAPDLLSGMAPNGGGTAAFPNRDAINRAFSELTPEQITENLNAVADYALKLPETNGKIAVAGFCWGGMQSFAFATNRKDLAAAFVFYGTGPETAEEIARIQSPVYGFYGGNDNRVNATLDDSAALMKAAGKIFEPVIYEGAGHAFMRAGEDPAGSAVNKKAREAAWTRWKALLAKL
jgi:carboxymethylenebutenolidase